MLVWRMLRRHQGDQSVANFHRESSATEVSLKMRHLFCRRCSQAPLSKRESVAGQCHIWAANPWWQMEPHVQRKLPKEWFWVGRGSGGIPSPRTKGQRSVLGHSHSLPKKGVCDKFNSPTMLWGENGRCRVHSGVIVYLVFCLWSTRCTHPGKTHKEWSF